MSTTHQYRIRHDDRFLAADTNDLQTPWLEAAVAEGQPLQWEMFGEVRLIPVNLLEDMLRIIQAHDDLRKVGRCAEFLRTPLGFYRDQTIPVLPEYGPVVTQSATPSMF